VVGAGSIQQIVGGGQAGLGEGDAFDDAVRAVPPSYRPVILFFLSMLPHSPVYLF
jgi:hypothetical protein